MSPNQFFSFIGRVVPNSRFKTQNGTPKFNPIQKLRIETETGSLRVEPERITFFGLFKVMTVVTSGLALGGYFSSKLAQSLKCLSEDDDDD